MTVQLVCTTRKTPNSKTANLNKLCTSVDLHSWHLGRNDSKTSFPLVFHHTWPLCQIFLKYGMVPSMQSPHPTVLLVQRKQNYHRKMSPQHMLLPLCAKHCCTLQQITKILYKNHSTALLFIAVILFSHIYIIWFLLRYTVWVKKNPPPLRFQTFISQTVDSF